MSHLLIGLRFVSVYACPTESRLRKSGSQWTRRWREMDSNSARNRDPGEMGRTTLDITAESPRGGGPDRRRSGPRPATYSAGNSNALLYIRGGVPLGCLNTPSPPARIFGLRGDDSEPHLRMPLRAVAAAGVRLIVRCRMVVAGEPRSRCRPCLH